MKVFGYLDVLKQLLVWSVVDKHPLACASINHTNYRVYMQKTICCPQKQSIQFTNQLKNLLLIRSHKVEVVLNCDVFTLRYTKLYFGTVYIQAPYSTTSDNIIGIFARLYSSHSIQYFKLVKKRVAVTVSI